MINLFEYQNKEEFKGDFESLEIYLDEIWSKREKSQFYSNVSQDKIEAQRFLQFIHKTNELKSNKYVGLIQYEGHKINLLPKIFFDSDREYTSKEVDAIHLHIMWWLSYCRKIKFPHYQTSLGRYKNDFFETLIYLFAKYTRELLSNTIYQQYNEVNKEVNFIKGNLNTTQYINENISKGRWQYVNCTFDSFQIDNRFNRIIKYVANLLFKISANSDNKRYLREILFILDEVSDVRATAEECNSIQFNPIFSQFERVRDYCYLFLSNSISITYKNNLKLFAFLLPMEYVFEDFVFGFIDKETKEVSSKAQSTSKFLDEGANFMLRPDLLLKVNSKEIIADTKYKIIYSNESNPQKRISQADIYQMLTYALRFKIGTIILFYPCSIKSFHSEEIKFIIKDEFANTPISIQAFQLPIINNLIFNEKHIHNENTSLEEMFQDTKQTLASKLISILFE